MDSELQLEEILRINKNLELLIVSISQVDWIHCVGFPPITWNRDSTWDFRRTLGKVLEADMDNLERSLSVEIHLDYS